MDELLLKLPMYAEMIAQFLGALAIFATVIVKITPSKSDNATVRAIADKIFKLISYLPTIGINPKTKEIQEAYDKLK